jgi:hypothetical protein
MKKLPDIEVAKKMINLQQSATSRNIEFDLTFETVKHLMTRTHCYYTGVKFEEDGKIAFSVDRVDSKKGYVEGNVVACTVDINSKKSNLTHEEIKMLNDKINEFLGKTIKKQHKAKPQKNEEIDISADSDIIDDVVQLQSEEPRKI